MFILDKLKEVAKKPGEWKWYRLKFAMYIKHHRITKSFVEEWAKINPKDKMALEEYVKMSRDLLEKMKGSSTLRYFREHPLQSAGVFAGIMYGAFGPGFTVDVPKSPDKYVQHLSQEELRFFKYPEAKAEGMSDKEIVENYFDEIVADKTHNDIVVSIKRDTFSKLFNEADSLRDAMPKNIYNLLMDGNNKDYELFKFFIRSNNLLGVYLDCEITNRFPKGQCMGIKKISPNTTKKIYNELLPYYGKFNTEDFAISGIPP